MSEVRRLLQVDGHVAFREALAKVLESSPGVRTVAEASTASEAMHLRDSFDIALICLPLSDDTGPRLIREMLGRRSAPALVVMVDEIGNAASCLAYEAGARRILARSTPLDQLTDHLSSSDGVELAIDRETSIGLLGRALDIRTFEFQRAQLLSRLTTRELQILGELADGCSDREIADRLAISVDTVRTHFVHILEKMSVRTRIQALVMTLDYGLHVRAPIGPLGHDGASVTGASVRTTNKVVRRNTAS
jgi:DNA-binding NarL/FixJ family response regulator